MGIRSLSLLENPSTGQLKPVNAIYIIASFLYNYTFAWQFMEIWSL